MARILIKSLIAFSIPAAIMSACGTKEKSPLLEGKINVAEPTELTFIYDIDGDVYHESVTTDSTGLFTFDPQLTAGATELAIYTGHDVYGAYIEQGKTTRMDIDGENVTFDGDNTELNDFVNTYEQSYSPWKFKPTPDKPFDFDDYEARRDNGYRNTIGKLEAIKDNTIKERYSLRNEARNKYLTMMNLQLHKLINKADVDAQLDSIASTIDPNADETRLSGLITYWYDHAGIGRMAKATDAFNYFTEVFGIIDSVLTNDANKKSLYMTMGEMFFMYQPDDSTAAAFIEKVKPQLDKAPKVAEAFNEIIEERASVIKDGSALPTDPVLIAPDGSKTTLSAELQGKVVYIDIWATWCGPCCREIPFMEKLAEKYKGNDNIRFISISEDEDRDAWLEKLDRDKPEWPQFIFDQKTGAEFRQAMSINAIPRFLLIGRDGRLISVDAKRPSDESICATLDAAIAQ